MKIRVEKSLKYASKIRNAKEDWLFFGATIASSAVIEGLVNGVSATRHFCHGLALALALALELARVGIYLFATAIPRVQVVL